MGGLLATLFGLIMALANGHDLDLYDADACLNASIEIDRSLQLRRTFPFLGRCRLPDRGPRRSPRRS